MDLNSRQQKILQAVQERGFVTVSELSQICGVTETTIRRDLSELDSKQHLKRTHGGAFSAKMYSSMEWGEPFGTEEIETEILPDLLEEDIDVLITTSVSPHLDNTLLEKMQKRNIPIIAESVWVPNSRTLVAVDNFQAARELGIWAGNYVKVHTHEEAHLLDLTFDLPNTTARSQGFLEGFLSVLPTAKLVLSINAQSRKQKAYQLAADALAVHPEINVIFAINDATAAGALMACQELGIPTQKLLLVTFGLTGDTLKEALIKGTYCKAGLAMFPDIVGRVCIEAAISAYNNIPLPAHLVTPYAVITSHNLHDYYIKSDHGWIIHWENVFKNLSIPLPIDKEQPRSLPSLPRRIGLVVPFMEHEWYQKLNTCMRKYASHLDIDVSLINADKMNQRDLMLRQRAIAKTAAGLINNEDVILLDHSQITLFLAEELIKRELNKVTVISNSLPILALLRDKPQFSLISTGGALQPNNDMLTGPIAISSLKELRADKLFFSVAGVSLDFGLSHTNLIDVTIKQAMMRTARDIILLADYTTFGKEAVMQVGSISMINKVITDDALPAIYRLEFNKLNKEVIIATTE